MRETKFRAWFKEENEMRDVAMLRWENDRMSRIAGYWKGTRDNGWTDYDPQDAKIILMQYTGLKDKNGKEIYEGDLLQLMPNGYAPRTIYEVKWNESNSAWNIIAPLISYKIIGNIYENPDLLANKEKIC